MSIVSQSLQCHIVSHSQNQDLLMHSFFFYLSLPRSSRLLLFVLYFKTYSSCPQLLRPRPKNLDLSLIFSLVIAVFPHLLTLISVSTHQEKGVWTWRNSSCSRCLWVSLETVKTSKTQKYPRFPSKLTCKCLNYLKMLRVTQRHLETPQSRQRLPPNHNA